MRRISPEPDRHIRVGPGIDVAACGARGALKYAQSLSGVGCPDCQVIRRDPARRAATKTRRGKVSAGMRRAGVTGTWTP